MEHYPVERMWDDIFTNIPQVRAFREFRVELMNCPVEYKEEITCKDVDNIAWVYDTNGVHIGKYNA